VWLLRGTDWVFKCSSGLKVQPTAYLTKPESLFTLQLKREEQEFLNSSLSARNKQMFTKGFLFVLKDSQSSMKFLKGFSCSKIVMFTVEDSSKFLTRHGSVIAVLHLPHPHPTPPPHTIETATTQVVDQPSYKRALPSNLCVRETDRQTNCCSSSLSFNLMNNLACYNTKMSIKKLIQIYV